MNEPLLTRKFKNEMFRFTHSPRLAAFLLIISLAILPGCLSKPALRKEHFLISPAPPPLPPGDKAIVDDIVSLRPVNVASPFAGRSLVYRVSETGYEVDPYAEFLVSPERMLGGTVRQWLRSARVFRDVLEPESQAAPTRVVELHVMDFYGDFRPGQEPAAVLALRFTLFARREAGADEAPFTREVSRRVTLRERSAVGVVQGLQQALGEALTELATVLAAPH